MTDFKSRYEKEEFEDFIELVSLLRLRLSFINSNLFIKLMIILTLPILILTYPIWFTVQFLMYIGETNVGGF